MQRRDLLKSAIATGLTTAYPMRTMAESKETATEYSANRAYWLEEMHRVAHPVLSALSQKKLRATMPVESYPGIEASRRRTTYLEAFGRLLTGIAPWLEDGATTGKEGELRAEYLRMARQALAAGVEPQSPDYLQFGSDRQTLVDAAFLSLAMLRAPKELNAKLDSTVRKQLADGLRATRLVLGNYNNWLLFAAGVEAALFALGQPWDRMRIDYALREHMHWYTGDGAYGDGPRFHFDYYNSFVIQPFLLAILDTVGHEEEAWKAMIPAVRARATRYARVQESLIAQDGSYPATGRSIAYRCGAFQLLADVALRHSLPEEIAPEQARCALSAVLHRTLDPTGTFDKDGWLRIGLAGHQPSLGEEYISTGSLYLCAAVFLPLGLPADDRFWSAPDAPWSAQKIWRGDDVAADRAIDE